MIVYFFQKAIWPPFTAGAKFFLRFKVEGQENFKLVKGKQYIIIANHKNYVDAFLVCASIPFFHFLKTNFRFMTIAKMVKKFPFIMLFGAYPLYKKGDIEKTLKSTERKIKNKKHLLIFPEGKINYGNAQTPAPARPGIAYLAKKYNLPIVPIAIKGAGKITLKNYFLRRANVTAIVGKPFYYKEVSEHYTDNHYIST